jgi:hypothetical protein
MNEKLGGKSWLVCMLLEALGRRNKAFYKTTALQETCTLFARTCFKVKATKFHGVE